MKPEFETLYSSKSYAGRIRFKDIEEYAHYLSDEYGWTSPDARIYYKNGVVKEIFSSRDGRM